MLQSQFLSKTRKDIPKNETSLNAKLLIKGGFIDKLMAGTYTFLPLGVRALKKIENIVREEIEKIGGVEILMPVLQPKENWILTGRWAAMPDLFSLAARGETKYILGATHEEIITPLVKKFISSYKDLPLYLYQIQVKFRKEKRAKSGLLRGKEFLMKDLYSFSRGQKELDEYYEKVSEAYERIFRRCGIWRKTYFTFAAGGTFAKYSHEFQTITAAGEDTLYICENCRIAVNKEIIGDLKYKCPQCGKGGLKQERGIEVGNIFKLGTKFSKAFGFYFNAENGTKNLVVMGSYGIGISRVMGAVVETNNDKKGIIWPEEIAPFKVHLLRLATGGHSAEVSKKGEDIYQKLLKSGVETLYDEREYLTAGEKFADADLIGCPWRVVVSARTIAKKGVELKKRNEDKTATLSVQKAITILSDSD